MNMRRLAGVGGISGVFLALALALTACAASRPLTAAPEPWYPAMNENGDPVFAVFEGRIPCTNAAAAGCEKIKVALVLCRDDKSKSPTTYKLARVAVATNPEGSRLVTDGAWRIAHGTKLDPSAPVIQLDSKAAEGFRSYWAIGRDILFMLDKEMSARVGTASWSYVLNKTHPPNPGQN